MGLSLVDRGGGGGASIAKEYGQEVVTAHRSIAKKIE